jgi:hypothetical protein
LPDAAGGLTRLDGVVLALERLSGASLRVWRQEGDGARTLAGAGVGWTPPMNGARVGRQLKTPDGTAWFEPVPDADGVWIEIRAAKGDASTGGHGALAQIVGTVLATEQEAAQVAAELSDRYEEIDLMYSISEILGHTIRLEDAAQRILAEVSGVVRAGRATLLALDEERRVLRLIASQGMDPKDVEPLELDDPLSVAARVFREARIISYDPTDVKAHNPGSPEGRQYKGKAFLSVTSSPRRPASHLADRHHQPHRPLGGTAFTTGVASSSSRSPIRSAPRSKTPGSWP